MLKSTRPIVAAVALVATAGAAMAERLTIRWGADLGYRPFTYKSEAGEPVGFDIDIGNAICEILDAECTWVEQPWDGIIPALQAGKYDAILSSMSITEDRKRVLDFTGKYYAVPFSFAGRADHDLSVENLAGKAIGVESGSVTEKFVQGEFPDAVIRAYPAQDEIWLDLAAGRIDAGMANMIVVQESFLETEAGEGFALFGPKYTDPKYFGEGTGIALPKSETELRDRISAAILELRENGKYQEINAKYFPFDIYGE